MAPGYSKELHNELHNVNMIVHRKVQF